MAEEMDFRNIMALAVILIACGCGSAPRLPPLQVKGRWHKVQKSDTIKSVAGRYKSDAGDIAELNDIRDDADLRSRKEVFIPLTEGKTPGGHSTTGTGSGKAAGGKKAAALSGGGSKGSGSQGSEKPAESTSAVLKWPVNGKVTSGFGIRRGRVHEGIDISVKKGVPVKAAADGVVLYSGSELKGYGNLVILRHDNDLVTVYAHNSKNKVKEGDRVKCGQVVSLAGDTGRATAPHLHFEVRKGDKPRNPLLFLPYRK